MDWERFRAIVKLRMGWLHVEKPAALLAKEFSGVVIRSAEEGLGERRPRGSGGYEWWTFELDKTRKLQCKLRRAWQSKRRLGGRSEELARMPFHSVRARYRTMMVEAQQSQHRKIANSGNEDPWGFAYRLSSGRNKHCIVTTMVGPSKRQLKLDNLDSQPTKKARILNDNNNNEEKVKSKYLKDIA
ncbi:unnamed protein product [Parnassius mnemosyne]|uniref:Uncharacterized protein n=1 Tax=Parnassius mnemosyne TaxID=213953 RepID=A0AAV1KGR8_9NEOP